jgi:hypothetical protein
MDVLRSVHSGYEGGLGQHVHRIESQPQLGQWDAQPTGTKGSKIAWLLIHSRGNHAAERN